MEKIILHKIVVDGYLIEYHYSVTDGLKHFFQTNKMFLEYEQDMSSVPISILTIPFVSCMAGLMWLSNCAVYVDEIDRTFYDALKQIKSAFQELHYNTPLKGVLIPSIFRDNVMAESQNCLLLFGGGVDCHCSYLRNKDIISDVCNINGWLNTPESMDKVDQSDKRITEGFAKSMSINSSHVRSNFASQFRLASFNESFDVSYWYEFLHSMAFIAISIPLCCVKNLSKIIIASSFTKGRSIARCSSYITTDSEFRFAASGSVVHDGFELSRQDKVRFLVEYQRLSGQPYPIQVCSFNDNNCGECEKCFRTIIAIVAEGGVPSDFGFRIPGGLLNHWKKVVYNNVGLWGVEKEKYYYNQSRQRMRENYDIIQDKEFVDWFLNFDFDKAHRQGLRRYYRQNFFSILKRKMFSK